MVKNKDLITKKSFISNSRLTGVFLCFVALLAQRNFAQDIEPRRWTSLPLGTQIVGVAYGYTDGDIFFDPVLQAEDVTVSINAMAVQYVRPFKIGNKLSRLDVLVPYSTAKWKGLLAGVPTTVKRNGFADPRVRLSVNLVGPEAMKAPELREYMATHPVSTSIGVSLGITLPFGQYFEDKLLNLGQNRFVIRPQIGLVHKWGLWSYEFTGSVFIFTNNENFFNGVARKQDPVFAVQTHLIKRFKNRIWGSLSLGSGLGGQSIINKQPNDDERGDILGALSFGFPIMKNQTVKLALIRAQTLNDIGANTSSFALGWSVIF
jgi:hypothetical protein